MSPDIAVSLLLGKPKKMKICYFFSQVSGHCVGDARQQYILEAYNLSSVTMVTMGSGLREERQRFLCIQVSQMTRSAEEFDMTEHHESSTIAWIQSTWLFSVKVRTLTCSSLQSCTSSNMAIRTRREISGFRSWTQVPEHPEVCPSKDSRYCLSVGLWMWVLLVNQSIARWEENEKSQANTFFTYISTSSTASKSCAVSIPASKCRKSCRAAKNPRPPPPFLEPTDSNTT